MLLLALLGCQKEIPPQEVEADVDTEPGVTCYLDYDGDGFGDESFPVTGLTDCTQSGLTDTTGDCNDLDADTNPGVESDPCIDGVDNDCDGRLDEDCEEVTLGCGPLSAESLSQAVAFANVNHVESVYVCPGEYAESSNILVGKSITISGSTEEAHFELIDAYFYVYTNEEDPINVTIDNLTLQCNSNKGFNPTIDRDTSLYVSSDVQSGLQLTLNNLTISDCEDGLEVAPQSGTSKKSINVYINDSKFSSNGTAIYSNGANINVDINNSTITENSGGIFFVNYVDENNYGSTLTISDSDISFNTLDNTQAVGLSGTADAVITNSTITDNTSTGTLGALYISSGGDDSSFTIEDSEILRNHAEDQGGGMTLHAGHADVTNSNWGETGSDDDNTDYDIRLLSSGNIDIDGTASFVCSEPDATCTLK